MDNREEYENLYLQALMLDDDFEAPVLPLEIKEGQDPGEAFAEFLVDRGILVEVEEGYHINYEKAEEYNPNLSKFLATVAQAEADYYLDKLEADGYIYSSIDPDTGDMIYGATEKGHSYIENSEDN